MNRELQLPDVRLRYRDDGAGRAVVFVHGWTLDLDMWDPQAPLAAKLRVIRYDRRGHGLSSGLPSPAADVGDLRALLDALGVVSPLLVGMSQGARVVLEFAVRHPGVARGLVLDGPPPLASDASDLPMDEFRRIAAGEGLEAFRQRWRAHPLTQLVTGAPPAHALLARILERYPGHDLVADGQDGESIEPARLAALRIPVLILNGVLDTEARRRAGLELREVLPIAEHVFIPRAAHLPNLDAPQTYNELMSGFARRHLSAAA